MRHAHQREHISTLYSLLLEQGHLGDLDKRRQLAWPGLPVHHTLDNEGIIVVAFIGAGGLLLGPRGLGLGSLLFRRLGLAGHLEVGEALNASSLRFSLARASSPRCFTARASLRCSLLIRK